MQWVLFFKKLYLRIRYHFIDDQSRRLSPRQQPNRKLCEDLLTQLASEQFRRYRPAIGLGITLSTRYATIDSYTQRMKETVRLLRENKPVPSDWVAEEEVRVSLDRFLTSDDGYYLDVVQAVSQFKAVGIQLCQEMVSSDTQAFGLPEHNLRMLTKLFINLRDITTMLIEVSLA